MREGDPMRRFDILALCTAALVSLRYGPISFGVTDIYLPHASRFQWALWITGWAIATYGPILAAALCWRWSRRSRRPIVPHLLFLPCAFLLFDQGGQLMLSVTELRDFDDTVGAPIMGGMLLLMIAIVLYFSALFFSAVASAREKPAR